MGLIKAYIYAMEGVQLLMIRSTKRNKGEHA